MKKIVFTGCMIIAVAGAYAQGCSDAGVCTIHSFKNNNEVVIGFAFGKGERFTSNYTQYLEYTRSIGKNTSLTGKLVFAEITGELANTSGLGDLFVSVNHAFDTKRKWQKSFVLGLKFPFDKADIVKNGIHLPMPYQTSLGTTDLVLGISYALRAFGATLAVQQPLKPVNGNQFLPENYPDVVLANRYLPSNKFSRKGDVLLRFSYRVDIHKKFAIRPSLLSIYHLADDTYLDASKTRREIAGSNGLTLNGNVFFDYQLGKTSGFELSFGTPFVVRNNRPDGLTRSFVASIEYKFSF